MTKFRRFLQRLQPLMPYLNIGLAIAAYLANEYWVQGFCQPVKWAAWVLAISTAAFLLWPWLQRVPVINYLLHFLMGVHFTVCVYCGLFIGPGQMVLMLLFSFLLFPLLLWVPVVFALQSLNRALVSQLWGAKVAFGLGVLALLPVQAWAELQYREIEKAVDTLPVWQRRQVAALARVVPRNYMAERLAGAYFKYHNYECFVLDGWRPPLHDPLVNLSLWSRPSQPWDGDLKREDNPLLVGFADEQAILYHELFPELPVKADCVCSHHEDGESYQNWTLPWEREKND